MRITFRFTDNEYRQFRQLNRTSVMARWKRYSLALICLVPSFCLILGTQSLIAILAASTILVSVLFIAIVAAIGDKPIVDRHDHVMAIDQSTALQSQSHSRWETRWDYYDQFQETNLFYLLRRLDRFTAIPKRSLEDSQRGQFASYCEQIGNDSGSGSEAKPAVPLFNELFGGSGQFEVFEFAYLADDLSTAMSHRLRRVDLDNAPAGGSSPKPRTAQRLLGTFWLMVFSGILFYIVTASSQIPESQYWNLSQILYLILAILLPFKLMQWLNRWFRSRRKSSAVRVPTEAISMQLMPSGWAVGNPKSCQFFDWRDVNTFYQNQFCFGFQTFNDLVQIIPKRIFSTLQESEEFIERAVSLRREHLRNFADTAVAVETGNPYQAPIS